MSRILLVEDEPLIASMLCDWLGALGHEVVGPTAESAQAFNLIDETVVDAAIVDIAVRDGDAYALADELKRRRLPFVFATGYPTDTVESRFGDIPILSKPFDYESFKSAVQQMVALQQTVMRRFDVSRPEDTPPLSFTCAAVSGPA